MGQWITCKNLCLLFLYHVQHGFGIRGLYNPPFCNPFRNAPAKELVSELNRPGSEKKAVFLKNRGVLIQFLQHHPDPNWSADPTQKLDQKLMRVLPCNAIVARHVHLSLSHFEWHPFTIEGPQLSGHTFFETSKEYSTYSTPPQCAMVTPRTEPTICFRIEWVA